MKTLYSFLIMAFLVGLLSATACQKPEDQATTGKDAENVDGNTLTPQIPDDIRKEIEARNAEKANTATTTTATTPEATTQTSGNTMAEPTVQVVGQVKISKKLTPAGIEKYAGQPGVVRIHWETQSEKDNFGFNVLRSSSDDGEFIAVNKDIIAGAGNSSTKRSYDYYDATVKVGEKYYYYLVDIKVNGVQNEIVGKTPITVKLLNLEDMDVDDSDPTYFVQN